MLARNCSFLLEMVLDSLLILQVFRAPVNRIVTRGFFVDSFSTHLLLLEVARVSKLTGLK